MPAFLTTLALALAPLTVLARTDLVGCTSSVSGPSLIWYVPGTGELCDFLDCGGGRAPVKTTVPGCPAYSGTASYSPSYLPGYGPNAQASATATATVTPIGSGTAYVPVISSTTALSSSVDLSLGPGPVVISSSIGLLPPLGSGATSPAGSVITAAPTMQTHTSSKTASGYSSVMKGNSTNSDAPAFTGAANVNGVVVSGGLGLVGVIGGLMALL